MVKFWKTMGTVGGISTILVLVGALNWGLVALNFNLVEKIFGVDSLLTNLVYIAVGLSSLISIYLLFLNKK